MRIFKRPKWVTQDNEFFEKCMREFFGKFYTKIFRRESHKTQNRVARLQIGSG
jgi:hypothetical protein